MAQFAFARAFTGKYVGKALSELTALKTELETARSALLTRGVRYSRPGFSFDFTDFNTITNELAEVEYAIRVAGQTHVHTTYADVS